MRRPLALIAVTVALVVIGVTVPGLGTMPAASAAGACSTTLYVAGANGAYATDPVTNAVSEIGSGATGGNGYAVAVSPDASTVAWTAGANVFVLDRTTSATRTVSVPGAVFLQGVGFTPDGSALVLVDNPNNTIEKATVSGGTWITGTWSFGGPLTLPNAGSNDAYALAITIDSAKALVPMSLSNTVVIVDLATMLVDGAPIPVGLDPEYIAMSPDGSAAWVSNYSSHSPSDPATVSRIAVAAPHTVTTIAVGPASPTDIWSPTGIVVSEDSASVWVVTRAPDKIRRIDVATNLVVPADDIDLPEPNYAPLALQPHSTRLWTGHYGYPAIQILSADTVTKSVVSTISEPAIGTGGLAFSPCPVAPEPTPTTTTDAGAVAPAFTG